MRSYPKGTIVPTYTPHPNAFNPLFLSRLAERDEPPTAGDADVAGPWRIEPIPGHGFGLFRIGESLARAAILPGTGRDPLFRIEKEADADGVYPLIFPGPDGGEVVGRLHLFDEAAVDAMNVLVHLLRSPESLAFVLEAAGAVALERCGAILDERVAASRAGKEDAE